MTKRTVWVLQLCIPYEGNSLLGVFSSSTVAKKWYDALYVTSMNWSKLSPNEWDAGDLELTRERIIDNAVLKANTI